MYLDLSSESNLGSESDLDPESDLGSESDLGYESDLGSEYEQGFVSVTGQEHQAAHCLRLTDEFSSHQKVLSPLRSLIPKNASNRYSYKSI